jgi:hypothetical protein
MERKMYKNIYRHVKSCIHTILDDFEVTLYQNMRDVNKLNFPSKIYRTVIKNKNWTLRIL